MIELVNHLEIYKILPKTNCRECRLPTCLAFAVAAMKHDKKLSDCPYLAKDVLESHRVRGTKAESSDDDYLAAMKVLQQKAAGLDLGQRAEIVGGQYADGRLTMRVLGKNFYVEDSGFVASQCHTNYWLAVPILNYVLSSAGREPVGEWLPLRDLKHGGEDWWRLFGQRCEKPLKKLVDEYTGLMELIIDIFDGRPAPDQFNSDLAVIIHPLPKLPLLICYWQSEEGMESSLNLFFDRSAEQNLIIDSIYTLCTGLVIMFEKIARTHGK